MIGIIAFLLAMLILAAIAIVLHVRHMVRLDQEDRE